MKKTKNTRFIISLISFFVFVISTLAVVIMAKGYIINFSDKKIEKTGIIIVNTEPKGAIIYLNDQLQTTSNANLTNLKPDIYRLKIKKDGYSTWEKEINVEESKVTQIDIRLFPSNPTLSPVTTYECDNPKSNNDKTKLVFAVKNFEDKNGIWLLSFNNLPFNKGYDLYQLINTKDGEDYSKYDYFWHPNNDEVLLTNGSKNLLVNINTINTTTTTTNDTKEKILSDWEKEDSTLKNQKYNNLPNTIREKTPISNISWSPYQNIIYFAKDDQLSFYNLETQQIIDSAIVTSGFQSIYWYPNFDRLLLVEFNKDTKYGKISAIDYDGKNKVSIYEGMLLSSQIFVSPNGEKLLFITNFNPGIKNTQNLYMLTL